MEEEQVRQFTSDFRIVADYFVQKRKDKDYRPKRETIKHVDAVLKLMATLTNDSRFEEIQVKEGDDITMCDVLDRIEEKGRLEGRQEGRLEGQLEGKAQLIKNALEAGFSKADVKKILKVTEGEIAEAEKLMK